MSRRRHSLLPHTADLRVEVRERGLPELYAACVEALFSLLTDRRRIRRRAVREVRIEAETPEERLFLLLRAAFALFSVDGFLVRRAHVTIGKNVTLTAWGEPRDAARHAVCREIKAVTAHALAVERTAGGVLARFVLDV